MRVNSNGVPSTLMTVRIHRLQSCPVLEQNLATRFWPTPDFPTLHPMSLKQSVSAPKDRERKQRMLDKRWDVKIAQMCRTFVGHAIEDGPRIEEDEPRGV